MWAHLIQAECPEMHHVPVWYSKTNQKFLCAVYFTGTGNDDAVNACNNVCFNGDSPHGSYVVDGENLDADKGYFYPSGSLIVRPGCMMHLFQVTKLIKYSKIRSFKDCDKIGSWIYW